METVLLIFIQFCVICVPQTDASSRYSLMDSVTFLLLKICRLMDVFFIAICLPRVNGPVAIQAMKNVTVMTIRNSARKSG